MEIQKSPIMIGDFFARRAVESNHAPKGAGSVSDCGQSRLAIPS